MALLSALPMNGPSLGRCLFLGGCLTVACGSPSATVDGTGGVENASGGLPASGGSGGSIASGGAANAGGTAAGGQHGSGGTGGYAGGVFPENCLALCQLKADGDCLGVQLSGCQDSCGKPTYFGDANACPQMAEDYYACLLSFDACTSPPECADESTTYINQCLGTP